MKIATYNINSIRTRLPRLLDWLGRERPDVVCLQETKVTDDLFPRPELEALGYRVEIHGQPTYNGVAILSLAPLGEVRRGLPGDDEDKQARYLAATVDGVRVIDVYVPNGSEVGSDKYAYKLAWLERLRRHLEWDHAPGEPLVLCGDFNIAPEDRDVHDPRAWAGKVLCSDPERAALRGLLDWGLTDAFRAREPGEGHYSWWDYRGGAFWRGQGLRIDLHLVTPPVAARVREASIRRDERKGDKPSDHAPVVLEIAEA